MDYQISLFDVETKTSPERWLVGRAHVNWTTSKQKIIQGIEDELDIKTFAKIVRREYCPYGFNGAYGCSGDYTGYTMTTKHIEIELADKTKRIISWEDFAREIYFAYLEGEYEEDR